MSGFGYLAGGLVDGAQAGMQIASQYDQLKTAARERAARAALGKSWMQPAPPVPQPPMPGQASMPAHPAMDPAMGAPTMNSVPPPGQVAVNQLPPVPPAGGPAIPQGGAPPLPQAAAPPMPAPGPAPAAPAAPPAGPAPDAAADPASTLPPGTDTKPLEEAHMVIQTTAQMIQQANPNIKPEELFLAVQDHISTMKNILPQTKAYMDAQVRLAQAQMGVQKAAIAATARTDSADITADSRRDVANTNKDARIGSANITADSRRDVAQTAAGASRYATDGRVTVGAGHDSASIANTGTRAASSERNTDVRADANVEAAGVGAQGRTDAAVANAGGTPPVRQRPTGATRNGRSSARAPAPAPAAAAPPRPPQFEGQIAKGPSGTWVGRGGKWAKQ